jgi:hypothetical protein
MHGALHNNIILEADPPGDESPAVGDRTERQPHRGKVNNSMHMLLHQSITLFIVQFPVSSDVPSVARPTNFYALHVPVS